MARVSMTKEITGRDDKAVTYTVSMMPPMVALDLLIDLVKMIGPGLAPVFSNIGSLGALMDQDVGDAAETAFLGEAVSALTHGVDKETTKRAIRLLAEYTTVDPGVPLLKVIDLHFLNAGLGAMFQWIPFALQVQYDDFLGAIGSAMRSVPRPASKTAPPA